MPTDKLEFLAANVRNVHVVGGRAQIFKLFASENVDGDKMDLGVTVFSSLGGRHFHDLAWAALNDDEAVLPQGRALHREGGGGTGIGALERDLMLKKVIESVRVLPLCAIM